VDLDLKPPKLWRDWWRETRLLMLGYLGYHVERFNEFETSRGYHYYVHLREDVDAETANLLQFLLGDDHTRVKINQWRIERGIRHWNKLFYKTLWRKKRKVIRCYYCGNLIPVGGQGVVP